MWLIQKWDPYVTLSEKRPICDSFRIETHMWLIWKRDPYVTHLEKRPISQGHVSCHMYMWRMQKRDMSVAWHIYGLNSLAYILPIFIMGWLWLIGSIKLYVSFAKEPYKRDDILQKRPIILRSLLTIATPYVFGAHIPWSRRAAFTAMFVQYIWSAHNYGVATIGRLLKMIGLFCRM